MQLLILFFLALLLDIVADGFFGPMSPNRADVRAICPEFAAPQLLLHARHLFEDFARGDAFDDPYDFSWAVGRHRLHKEMYMVVVSPNLDETHFVSLGDFQTYAFQYLINFAVEHHTSIFRRAHNMV